MKYQGFREEMLLSVARQLENLGLKPSEVYAVMNLAGAKWRSVQILLGHDHESHDEGDAVVFSEATNYSMKHTIENTIEISKLTHSSEGEKVMLLSVGLTLNRLFTRGSRPVRKWLEDGNKEYRKIVLSFAIGSCILVDSRMIDGFFKKMIKFRYGAPFDGDKDISDSILATIEKLGNAGDSVLQPISGREYS